MSEGTILMLFLSSALFITIIISALIFYCETLSNKTRIKVAEIEKGIIRRKK